MTVGTRAPGGVGTDALLDFDVRLTLDGQALTRAEIERVTSASSGLALIRGQWVELDAGRLREALAHWDKVKATAGRDGLSFIEGMRLLAGAELGGDAEAHRPPEAAAWSEVVAGGWLADRARRAAPARRPARPAAAARPARRAAPVPDDRCPVALAAEPARARRVPGRRHGARQDGAGAGAAPRAQGARVEGAGAPRGAGIADRELDGGDRALRAVAARGRRASLGRPARARHALLGREGHRRGRDRRARGGGRGRHCRARGRRAVGTAAAPGAATPDLAGLDLVITTYGLTHRLPWLAGRQWPVLVLDEAQAIKNPGTRQTRAVKALRAQSRVAMTGTPVENRLGDLWSLFDFLNPGLLGSAQRVLVLHQAARGEVGRLRPAPRAHASVHPAPAQDRPADHRRPARQDRGARVLRAHPRTGRALPAGGEEPGRGAQRPGAPGGHPAPGPRARVPDAAQADLQPPLAVAAATARGTRRTAASSRACASSPR